jgi:ATP-dependent RNA helicase DeaD
VAEANAAQPPSAQTFDALPLTADVRRAIDGMGYLQPTPVQIAVFEPAVRGKNLVVQARTGTGKTAAFGLPIIDQLVRKSVARVQALILTPTRELALQVSRELERIAAHRGIRVLPIYGGAPMGQQIEALAEGAQIVSGTPGRVLDHIRRKTLDTSAIRIFVLDEADEMLSMGFAKELHAIAEALPKERQGLFFSATIPPDIERLATTQLKDPEFITLSSDQVGALEIAHFVYLVGPGVDKRRELVRILEIEDPESAVIFCNTREETERVAEALQNQGYDADWLNSDLEQRERERIMARTREGKLRFLVATDVAARGIDISHLTHVINYDFPEAAESYVHRTGRTGRAGRTGVAISLVTSRDVGKLYLLRLTYKLRPIEKQLPTATELKTRSEMDLVQTFVDAFGVREVHPDDRALARRLLTHASGETVLAALLREHLGARVDAKKEAAEARRAKNPRAVPQAAPPPPAAVVAPSTLAAPSPAASGAVAIADTNILDSAATIAAAPPTRSSRDRRDREGRPEREGRSQRRMRSDVTLPAPPPMAARNDTRNDTGNEDDDITLPGYSETPVIPTLAPAAADADFARLYVNVGKRDGARPGDIQKLLTDEGGIGRADTGPIQVRDRMTFVSVRRDLLDRAIAALAGRVIGGRTLVAEPARVSRE